MKNIFLFFVVAITTLLPSCKGDDVPDITVVAPVFNMVVADVITQDQAMLISTFTDIEVEFTTGFAYKEESTETVYVDALASESSNGMAKLAINSLKSDTEYRYYCYIIISNTRFNSLSKTFKTLKTGEIPEAAKPIFGVPKASNIEQTTATIECDLSYSGTGVVSDIGFMYKVSSAPSFIKKSLSTTIEKKSLELTGLTQNSDYTYYLYVVVDGKSYNSENVSFKTLDQGGLPTSEPTFGTPKTSNIGQTAATIACDLSYSGTEAASEIGFEYKASSATAYTKKTLSSTIENKSLGLTSLSESTSYSYYLYVKIADKIYKSTEVTFTTTSSSGNNAKYSGWAELPEENDDTDYLYAYHITDVKASGKSNYMRNYGVCFSRSRKCPIWVAAPLHDSYAVKNTNRSNAYKDDPEISGTYQIGKWDGGYNRGHLLSSADRLVSRNTNEQVFYHSNIGPQYSKNFNNGGGSWNTFEAYVDSQWRNKIDTLYTVIGCLYEGKVDHQNGSDIPSHYYSALLRTKNSSSRKWVVDCSAEELQCAVFVVKHEDRRGIMAEMFSVEEFEKRTKTKLFVNVPNAPKSAFKRSDWNY